MLKIIDKHKNWQFSQSNYMMIFIVFLVIAMLILLLVLPIKFTTKINLSLVTNKAIIAIKFRSFMPFVLIVEIKNERLRILINGKLISKDSQKHKKPSSGSFRQVSILDLTHDLYKLIEKIDCIGIFGCKDIYLTCCNYALITNIIGFFEEKIGKLVLVPDFQKERYIFDVEIKWSVSILDILQLVGEYGSKRNFKTNNRQFKRRNEQ
jgi:hypothetical protein